jgi:hypothetical protein
MNSTAGRTSDKKFLIVAIPVLLMLIPIGYSAVAWAISLGADDSEPFLEMPSGDIQECVRETEWMRFNHWTLLKEARDEAMRTAGVHGDIGLSRLIDQNRVVHEGERVYCSDCHTSREEFCLQCHSQANVMLDCYRCHEYK